jgi:hypothetical protein
VVIIEPIPDLVPPGRAGRRRPGLAVRRPADPVTVGLDGRARVAGALTAEARSVAAACAASWLIEPPARDSDVDHVGCC